MEPHEQWSSGDAQAVLDAFEQLPGFVWVFDGPELRVVAANPAVRAAVGDRSHLLGEPFRRAVPELAGQHIFELLDQALAGIRSYGYEQRVLTDRYGDGRLTEAFYTFDMAPWRNPDGSVRGVIVQAVDATGVVAARRAAEAAAAHAESRYQQAAGLILELQRSLLPDALPVLPRVQVAARYLVAGSELVAGGDWFDAVPLPDGRLALTVGDVVGHGAAAAAAMGQLRTVVRQALQSGGDLSQTLDALNRFAAYSAATRAATSCLAVLDARTGVLEVASHGHPAPLVLGPDGDSRFLPLVPARPLGTGPDPAPVHTCRLTGGDVLLMFTDGLIERPRQSLDESTGALASAAGAARRGLLAEGSTLPDRLPDLLCTLVTERLAMAEGGFNDDCTLLAAHLLPEPVAPLRLTLPADPAALRPMRRQVTGWLEHAGVDPEDTVDLVHAVGEAATNAIDHAYPEGGPADFTVEADLDDQGVVRLACADRGRWRPPVHDPGGRGRGLTMIRGLVDRAEVRHTDAGTTVRMWHRIERATSVTAAAAGQLSGPHKRDVGADEFGLTFVHAPAGRTLYVQGPVDLATGGQMRAAILQGGRGGTLPLTVDLTAVTHLTSTGVQILHELSGVVTGLRVAAAPGAPARAVLRLTALDHLLSDTDDPAAGADVN
ncbi:SpoIIE family protein phosphatase [Micromonospora mirobrigensis]|uniref:Serine phosphatase RsbU, regulator of sigma subunit n=1 Tax=Micromonospora mirobrigensis TaxID=262898 RepID=A0A1C4V2Y6_9ACTN|nr:SpoIIE family protein phosphatase [Micromonospora mirobrigensis]SCE78342.1 Serine phosphatase RsbU, regulator of sigma subunit [Micromonospora mirobrigensis]